MRSRMPNPIEPVPELGDVTEALCKLAGSALERAATSPLPGPPDTRPQPARYDK